MPLKRGFSDPNFEAGGESEYDREFRQALHLVTQRGQPYGSMRRCCEECGAMCWGGIPGSAKRWTDDPETWAEDRLNCRALTGHDTGGRNG